jgi:hypothetical protein
MQGYDGLKTPAKLMKKIALRKASPWFALILVSG